MKIPRNAVAAVTEAVLELGAKKATKYLDEKTVVKASRRFKQQKGERLVDVVLTCGRPNYAERQFIKDCRSAGEAFPVRKVQLAWYK